MGSTQRRSRLGYSGSPKTSILSISQKTLRFINDEATSIHGNVRVSSVFTTESGEWKLAGLELLSSMKEDDAVLYVRLNKGR